MTVQLLEPDTASLHCFYIRGKTVKLILALEILVLAVAFLMLHRALALRVAEAARWEEQCRMNRPFRRDEMARRGLSAMEQTP